MIRKKIMCLLCILACTFFSVSCAQEIKDDTKNTVNAEKSNDLENSEKDKIDQENKIDEEEIKINEETESFNTLEEIGNGNNPLKDYGHYLEVPKEWEVVEGNLIEQLFGEVAASIKGVWMLDEIGSNVTIVTEPNEMLSFSEYVDISKKNIESQEEFEDIKEIEYKTINDVDIALLNYNAKDQTRSVKIQQVILSANKDIFIVTLTNGTNSDEIQKSFDEFINTLKKI